MNEQRFRFPGCSPQRLSAARWCLFEYGDVRGVEHVDADVVSVLYEGEADPGAWIAHLREHGFRFDPIPSLAGRRDAA